MREQRIVLEDEADVALRAADQIVGDTLNVILKYEGDVQKAQNELAKLIEKKTAQTAAEAPQKAPAESTKKGILH